MTTQVAVSNENIEESVAAWKPLCISRGARRGFVNNGNQNAEVLCVTKSAASAPGYCCEPFEVNDPEFGGEFARF